MKKNLKLRKIIKYTHIEHIPISDNQVGVTYQTNNKALRHCFIFTSNRREKKKTHLMHAICTTIYIQNKSIIKKRILDKE